MHACMLGKAERVLTFVDSSIITLPIMQSPFKNGALMLDDMYVECFSAIDCKYVDSAPIV